MGKFESQAIRVAPLVGMIDSYADVGSNGTGYSVVKSADIKTSARGLLGVDLNQCLPTSSRLFSHIGASHIFSLITASLQLSPPPSFIAHRLLPPLTAIVASAATSLCGRLCCFPAPLIAAPEPDVKKQTVFFLQTADVWSTSSSAEVCRYGLQTADVLPLKKQTEP
ncbi:hypothetical protein LXL04_010306 [Taraxacum kok-saghyz]